MIDLLKLEAPEAERIAYAEGFTMAAELFARLAGHYPAPSVSSDYDKSVIFAAIEKGEGGAD